MLRSTLRFALRRLRMQPVSTGINVLGLGTGMAVCLMVLMLVADQRSYDRFHEHSHRIVRILSEQQPEGSSSLAAAPAYVATSLAFDVPEVEKTLRFGQIRSDAQANAKALPVTGMHTDPTFFDLFDFELIRGDESTALVGPGSIILTERAARRFFGDQDPIGEIVTLTEFGDYEVTGVLATEGVKSHLRFDVLASFATLEQVDPETVADPDNFWTFATYVLLRPGASPEALDAHLARYSERYVNPGYRMRTQRLTDITMGPALSNEIAAYNLPGIVVWALLGLAALVLVAATFNYVGLAVAQSVQRAREIGVRKAVGAGESQLRAQYLMESILTSFGALLLALALLLVLIPSTNSLSFISGLGIHIGYSTLAQPGLLATFVAFAAAVGVLAGLFPAFRLSRFQPVTVLRGEVSSRHGSAPRLRRGLAFFQLVISFVFVVASLLLVRQFGHMLDANYGFSSTNQVTIPLQENDETLLAQELARYPEIVEVGATSFLPAAEGDRTSSFVHGTDTLRAHWLSTNAGFVRMLSLVTVAGEGADALDGRAPGVLVNETATRRMGLASPQAAVGLFIRTFGQDRPIRGVVRDFQVSAMSRPPEPLVMFHDPAYFTTLVVSHPEGGREAAVARIRDVWNRVDGLHAFESDVYSARIRDSEFMRVFRDQIKIVSLVAFIALLVACLGLLSMISFAAARRTREVSIRKILGSSNAGVMWLLSREFLVLTAVAAVVGLPLAYVVNRSWLGFYYDHVSFGLGSLAVAALVVACLVALIVAAVASRAAAADPARVLRTE